MKTVNAAILLLLFSGISAASEPRKPEDGHWFIENCNPDILNKESLTLDEHIKESACMNYIDGFVDGYITSVSESDVQLILKNMKLPPSTEQHRLHPLLCLPKHTNDQIARIVYKYVTDNPQFLLESRDQLMVSAIGKAFCS